MRNVPRSTAAEIIDAVRRQATRKLPRRRPPGSPSALVEPPRGPLPKQGGTAAPLEFET